MLDEMLAAGTEVMPGIGSDIADPDGHEIGLRRDAAAAAASFIDDGLAPITDRYGELAMPLLLFTSRQDHVVEPTAERVPRRALRRPGRPPLARAQLPRGDAGLRPRRHQRRGGRVRRGASPGRDRARSLASAAPASIPSPSSGTPRDRAALAQRLRPDDRPRRRRRRVAVRPAARGEGHRHPRGRQRDRRVGRRRRRHRRPPVPRRSPTGSGSRTTSATSSRSGRAASASPAACSPASSSGRTSATGGASRSARASTPSRRRCRWPRRSGAGATTSTRSCTAGRPTCRGRWRSTTSTCRRAGYPPGTTFHPTFLYESLWNFGLCGVLLWIDKRFRPAGGRLLAMYVLGYGIGRFWVEGLRIDEADELGGLRWNQWVAIALHRRRRRCTCWPRSTSRRTPCSPPIVHGRRAAGRRRRRRRRACDDRRRRDRRRRRRSTSSSEADEEVRRSTTARGAARPDDVEGDAGRRGRQPPTGGRRHRVSDLVDHAELERFATAVDVVPAVDARCSTIARPARPVAPRRADSTSRAALGAAAARSGAATVASPSPRRRRRARRSAARSMAFGVARRRPVPAASTAAAVPTARPDAHRCCTGPRDERR